MHVYELYLNVLILLTTLSYLLRYIDQFWLSESELKEFFCVIFSLWIYVSLFVQIGPPNPIFLKSTDKSTWNAKDVADSVLSDKSALVIY